MAIHPITRLDALRRVRQLSQQELADRLGTSRTTIVRILSGEYAIDRYAAALARALECPESTVREAAGGAP